MVRWVDRVSTMCGVCFNAVHRCVAAATSNLVAFIDRAAFNRGWPSASDEGFPTASWPLLELSPT